MVSQKKYEREMVLRFGISHPADFPHVRLSEDDEFPSGDIKQAYIKWAQSMAGALLRLTTRTRPDIAMTASACRLAIKNPQVHGYIIQGDQAICTWSSRRPTLSSWSSTRGLGAKEDSCTLNDMIVCLRLRTGGVFRRRSDKLGGVTGAIRDI